MLGRGGAEPGVWVGLSEVKQSGAPWRLGTITFNYDNWCSPACAFPQGARHVSVLHFLAHCWRLSICLPAPWPLGPSSSWTRWGLLVCKPGGDWVKHAAAATFCIFNENLEGHHASIYFIINIYTFLSCIPIQKPVKRERETHRHRHTHTERGRETLRDTWSQFSGCVLLTLLTPPNLYLLLCVLAEAGL